MSSEEHLAFGQRLPEMCLAQGAGLWPGRGRGGWVKSRGKLGLQGLPTVPGVKAALPPLLCSQTTLGFRLMEPRAVPMFQLLS